MDFISKTNEKTRMKSIFNISKEEKLLFDGINALN
jgi:hypothetical protein